MVSPIGPEYSTSTPSLYLQARNGLAVSECDWEAKLEEIPIPQMRGPSYKAQSYRRGQNWEASKDPTGKKRMPSWRREIRVIVCYRYRKGLRQLSLEGRFIPIPTSPWGSWVLLCLARAVVTLTLTTLGLLTKVCKGRMCPMMAFALGLLAGVFSLWHVVSQTEPGNWVLLSPTRYSSLAAQVFN